MKAKSKVIEITQETLEKLRQFPKNSDGICFDEEKGLYVDLTISTDRSDDSFSSIKHFVDSVEKACKLVGKNPNDLDKLTFQHDQSDHEIVVQRQYILQNQYINKGFLYQDDNFSGIIQDVDFINGVFFVENDKGETKTLGINNYTCSNCKGFIVV